MNVTNPRTAIRALAVGMLVMLAAYPAVNAQPTELFFSEYIEGSSNNKALEIYNPGGAPVDLAANGYNVQMFFNGSASAGLTINLSGTVASGDVFVLAQSSAAADILAVADQTNGAGWFNGDDAVVLRKGTTILDVIGQIGFDPGSQWGSDLASTADNTLRRKATVAGGDTNGADAFDPSVEWEGFATNTFDGLGAYGDVTPPEEPPPAGGTCTDPFTRIYDIQGTGTAAAITGAVTTMGIVVGDHEGASPSLRGFYVQDATGDGNPLTSDGLFVFNGNNDNVAVGDLVRVTGNATEFQDQTQISATAVAVCGSGDIAPTDLVFPIASLSDLERFEGMLVRLPQTMYVTEHFQLGRFGQVVLSAGGRQLQPTAVVAPGAPAQAVAAANSLNRIILDDASQGQNPDPIVFARGGLPLSESNTLRGGDTATGIVGVLTYTWAGNSASGNAYRVRPHQALGGQALFTADNPRPESVPAVGGSLRVASANVLNYYNTFADCTAGLAGDPIGCRGAENDLEFLRQRAKTVAALLALEADVVGLIEIENDGYGPDSALQDLVNGLNEATAPGTWAFIDGDAATGTVDVLGSDGIKVALIYKPGVVSPVGQTAVINTGAFGLFQLADGRIQGRNRPSLAQSFEVGTGARFTVVVNHLISKGAGCELNVSPVGPDGDTGDGQGACNLTRLAAVQELTAWLAADPTGAADPDYLLLGDFNAYSMEDPIGLLETSGFANLVPLFSGPASYSYVFDGQWGSLDHALASPSLLGQVAGAAPYHINADEPSVLDYNTNFKSGGQVASLYAPDEFRSSDHDPLVVGINLNAAPTVSGGGPYVVGQGQSVLLQATGNDPDGGVLTFDWDLDNNGSFETPGADALFTATSTVGAFTVRVRATDAGGLTAVAPATVNVVFNWTGFFAPIDNDDVNEARAGRAVPVKFSLGGDQGTVVFAPGFPVSLEVDCTTGAALSSSPTANPGASGLTFDAASGQYVYVWKTDASWSGTCRRLVVRLIDGTMHEATFRFRH